MCLVAKPCCALTQGTFTKNKPQKSCNLDPEIFFMCLALVVIRCKIPGWLRTKYVQTENRTSLSAPPPLLNVPGTLRYFYSHSCGGGNKQGDGDHASHHGQGVLQPGFRVCLRTKGKKRKTHAESDSVSKTTKKGRGEGQR